METIRTIESTRACFAVLIVAAFSMLMSACTRQPVRPAPIPPEIEKTPPAPMPRAEPRSRSGNPPFYEVYGKRYFVLNSSAGYAERGVASWYGKDFHGGKTANGEKYDMHAMTAAHKTLPIPCHVQVTNLRNGRSVIVRVNDRGPFVGNRLIDLSFSAATQLDMIRDGTALVEVRAVDSNGLAFSAPSPKVPPLDSLYVQAGAFTEQANAERLIERLRAAGLGPAVLRRDAVGGRSMYRVRVGPVPSVADFDRVVANLKGLGIADARLALD